MNNNNGKYTNTFIYQLQTILINHHRQLFYTIQIQYLHRWPATELAGQPASPIHKLTGMIRACKSGCSPPTQLIDPNEMLYDAQVSMCHINESVLYYQEKPLFSGTLTVLVAALKYVGILYFYIIIEKAKYNYIQKKSK